MMIRPKVEEDELIHGVVEARVPSTLRAPCLPSAKEVADHNVTHVPYRSWCPFCVAAAAKATPHMRCVSEDDGSAFPHLHTDYWFMRDRQGDESVPVVVL